MKKYLPIKIFSIKYAYGWWWGKYFFFIGKHATAFAILPMCNHFHQCEYMNGKAIEDGAHHHYEVVHRIYGANAEEKVGTWNIYVNPLKKPKK